MASLINERIYAIGLGTADQLNPAALQTLTNNTGGYLLMTGTLGPGDLFRLSKYYLQILAGVTNADIVVDPESSILPKMVHRIPFQLTETDISSDVILLSPALWAYHFALETPNGDIIDRAGSSGIPGVTYAAGNQVHFYRVTLPAPVGPIGAREGTWHVLLRVEEGNFKEYLSTLRRDERVFHRVLAHGVPYSLSVHAYTNLRMRSSILQSSLQPGATLTLRALLTEYGLPVQGRASVTAELERPDRTMASLNLTEIEPGVFEGTTAALIPGVYHFRFRGSGTTLRRLPFSREQVLTAAVWKGGDATPPSSQTDPHVRDEQLCHLLECLCSRESLGKFFAEHNINPDALLRCIRQFCDERLVRLPEATRPQREAVSPPTRGLGELLAEPRSVEIMSLLSEIVRRAKG